MTAGARINDNSALAGAANSSHMLRIVEPIECAKSLR